MTDDELQAIADSLSDEQQMTAGLRALKTLGIEYTLTTDGARLSDEAKEQLDDDEFARELTREILRIHVEEVTRDLAEQGMLKQVLMDNGELGVELTEEGRAIVEELGLDELK